MPQINQPKHHGGWKHSLLRFMHILVLLGSIGLIVLISYDCFRNISFLANPTYMKIQLWICVLFMLDVVIEFFLSPKKLRYILTHLFFLLVSIPYLNLISYYHVELSPELQYLVRFIPMIRAAYVLTLVLAVFSSDKISSLFMAYVGLLIATVYFASMMFFIEEHYINPGVNTYWSALWWAFMDVTTVGCNINAITPTGKVLAVILAAEGLILFPVFTVYITNALTKKRVINTKKQSATVKNTSNSQVTPSATSN